MIAFAVPSLRYRAVAPGLGERGRIGSSTSHRIIAISCAKLGLDQSTPCPVQYDKYKAIRPAYVFSVLNARPAPRTPARYAHASACNRKSSSTTTHHTDSSAPTARSGR
ncbi:hypothetical protein [Nonomuraea bangladeshensis]|uniref:hypothetical protein n=1 Tax=Nonomuraea bangladeshensis TaxID=404385 RepID=UPI003C2E37CF